MFEAKKVNMLNKISLHHVGGRNGSRAFPILKSFEKDFVSVLYDADKDCIEQIKEKNLGSKAELHVLPYCLGRAKGGTEFNLNYDPFTSSLLKSDNAFSQYYQFYGNLDYVWGEATKTMKSFDIEISTLDSVLIDRNDLAKPDFLSIDTQGSEYDILLGAKQLLKEHILGLVLEVEFRELYIKQHLFGDIEKLLSSQGFEFIKFLYIGEFSAYRAPLGLRAEGEQVFAEALFLKRDDSIGNNTAEDYVKLRKLAFLAIAFNQLERGLLYLSKSKEIRISQEVQGQLLEYSYFRFLDELDREVALMRKQYPVTFADVYSFEESRSRFNSAAQKIERNSSVYSKIICLIKKNDILHKVLRGIRDNLRNSIGWFSCIVRLYLLPNTSVENLFCKYELGELAKKTKFNRMYLSTYAKLRGNKQGIYNSKNL